MTMQDIYSWISAQSPETLFDIWCLTVIVGTVCILIATLTLRMMYDKVMWNKDLDIKFYRDRLDKMKKERPVAPAGLTADRELPVNVFADTYHMKGARMPEDVPSSPQNIETHITCPECNWHGTLKETLKSYGHTLCPYCRKEFREISR